MFSPLIQQLIAAFRVLPGVGQKSAQRMAFHLLERERAGGNHLAVILARAIHEVGYCSRCRILSELEICTLCASTTRDASILCIVQTPQDVVALESAGVFKGVYYVLCGALSPLDGMGPEEIGITQLYQRLNSEPIQEMVIATHATAEGEATAFYISEMLKERDMKVSRIAFGVPLGGELEYVDANTLAKALMGRTEVV